MATKIPKPVVAKKPVTTFNKKYVSDRIEARQASLRSKIAAATTECKADDVVRASADEEYLQEIQWQADGLRAALDIPPSKAEDAGSLEEKVKAIRSRVQRMNDVRSSFDYSKMAGARERRGLIVIWQKELVHLDHAYAYFAESPVEEYSVTALRQLGLLDVVKFVITPAK